MKESVRAASLIIALAVVAAAVCFGISAMRPETTEEKNVLYSYTMSVGCGYEVLLHENELYPEGVLGEGRLYSRNLTDRVDITFSADYLGSDPAALSGDYSVSILLQGYQGASETRSVVYEQKYTLIENKRFSYDGERNAEVSEKVPVRPGTYRSFADKAEQILGAKLNRELQVVFNGSFIAKTEHGEVKEPFTYIIRIPLTNDLYSITKPQAISKGDAFSETTTIETSPGLSALFPPSIALFAGLAAVVVLVFFTRKPTDEEKYKSKFITILRKHGSRMVKLSAVPSITAFKQVTVADLEGLIKMSDELQRPICYFPDREGLPVDGLLYVPDGERYYLTYVKK